MKQELPEINRRIRDVVAHFANGNVSKLIRELNTDGIDVVITQQKVNRLFNIDTRTHKYPGVPNYIIDALTQTYSQLNKAWILTGEGSMLKEGTFKPNPGDRSNSIKAFMIAFLDDYANRMSKLTGDDPDEIKQSVEKNTKLLLGGLDQLPFAG